VDVAHLERTGEPACGDGPHIANKGFWYSRWSSPNKVLLELPWAFRKWLWEQPEGAGAHLGESICKTEFEDTLTLGGRRLVVRATDDAVENNLQQQVLGWTLLLFMARTHRLAQHH
jgi:hypothetical protein